MYIGFYGQNTGLDTMVDHLAGMNEMKGSVVPINLSSTELQS